MNILDNNKPISDLNFPSNIELKDFSNEDMVCIDKIHPKIYCANEYFKSKIPFSVNNCYVRKNVANKLVLIADSLPKNYKLKIFDAWRPYSVQKELYYKYRRILRTTFPDKDEKEFNDIVKSFVSFPVINKTQPFVHSTGGAVDLTLTYNDIELDMGSKFDELTERSNTTFYETNNINIDAKKNRRMLYNTMIKFGFTNLPSEWWHYDFGDGFWAFYNNTFPLYSGIFNNNFLNEKEL